MEQDKCGPHFWRETGKIIVHDGPMFKYGPWTAIYVRCARCGQMGFRRPGSRVVYTWGPELQGYKQSA